MIHDPAPEAYPCPIPWPYEGASMWPLINKSAEEILRMDTIDIGPDDDLVWVGLSLKLRTPHSDRVRNPHGYVITIGYLGTVVLPLPIESRAFLRHVVGKLTDLFKFDTFYQSIIERDEVPLVEALLLPQVHTLREEMTSREKTLVDATAWTSYFKTRQITLINGIR